LQPLLVDAAAGSHIHPVAGWGQLAVVADILHSRMGAVPQTAVAAAAASPRHQTPAACHQRFAVDNRM
jgi:hypothetical protein